MKFQYIKDKVSAYFTKGNERSVAVKKNIAVSLVLKCISIYQYLGCRVCQC